jgi:pimeloyl-ACP methyl ester carboxylesterase
VRQATQHTLSDGRLLGFLDCGDPEGRPIFFFCGFAMSAPCVHPDDAIADSLGVRLIAVDRPGIGHSSPSRPRSLQEWAGDVAALADALGFTRFGVLGWSAGGPHALACAALLGRRIAAVGIVSSAPRFDDTTLLDAMPPKTQWLVAIARHTPVLLDFGFAFHCRQVSRGPEKAIESALGALSPSDREIVTDPRFARALSESMRLACAHGASALTADAVALSQPWPFDPGAIQSSVCLWHGGEDGIVPCAVAQLTARQLPRVKESYLPTEGHFLYLRHWRDILEGLIQEWDSHS